MSQKWLFKYSFRDTSIFLNEVNKDSLMNTGLVLILNESEKDSYNSAFFTAKKGYFSDYFCNEEKPIFEGNVSPDLIILKDSFLIVSKKSNYEKMELFVDENLLEYCRRDTILRYQLHEKLFFTKIF